MKDLPYKPNKNALIDLMQMAPEMEQKYDDILRKKDSFPENNKDVNFGKLGTPKKAKILRTLMGLLYIFF